MVDHNISVDGHYGVGGILDRILKGLALAGKDLQSLAVDDLAPIDEFHSRGRDSTLELINLAEFSPSDKVLDVGCGLGGSARHIANAFQCQALGVDLTHEYVEVAEQLTKMVGLAGRVRFQHGSALELPFENGSFDVVWTEHAQMNIQNKPRFYAEIARVLKPGGRLMFHDIFQGEGEEPMYPVPWAEDASISFLVTEASARQLMEQSGLSVSRWEQKDAVSVEFFENVFQQISRSGPPPIGIHLLMGENAKLKLQNYVHNLTEKRVAVAMGRVDKIPPPAGV